MPNGHFSCPDWTELYAKNYLLLIVGRSDIRGSLRNDAGRRVGIFYGRPTKERDKFEEGWYVFAFANGPYTNGLIDTTNNVNVNRRETDWENWSEHWRDNSTFFSDNDLRGVSNGGLGALHQFLVYKNPFTGSIDDTLGSFLTNINENYGVNDNTDYLFHQYETTLVEYSELITNNALENYLELNVLTPLILSIMRDENNRLRRDVRDENKRRKREQAEGVN